jgi:hypothetical protein
MKKLFIFSLVLFAFNCTSLELNTIELKSSANTDVIFSKLKDMMTKDGYLIQEENAEAGIISSNWKKLDRSENNIPDNTIEGQINVTLSKVKNKDKVIVRVGVFKRSSLASENKKGEPVHYEDVGLIRNDKLYKKWDERVSELLKELEANKTAN